MGDGYVNSVSGRSIEVHVKAIHLPEQSDPAEARFVFAYTIRIANTGTVTATLRSRSWLITDGDGRVEEVHGAGVVGQQPRLLPEQAFEYTSGAVLRTPVGTMEGHYTMQTEDGATFDVPIPMFSLRVPGSFN